MMKIAAVATAAFVAAASGQIYSSSFEAGADGFVGTGDWERGIPNGFDGADYGGPEPVGGHTGDYVFGTVINGQHNPNTVSSLSQTFDFTGYSDVTLSYYEWLDSGGNSFDTAETIVNGDVLLLADGGPTSGWREVVLDLSAYDGMNSVTIDFLFSTTGVVERVGWYIDDVAIRGVPAPASAALLGLGGLVATRRRR
ncbi:MAG: PEP-CTERM sorting domain-containing protein [Phycisphaerales bacterium JB041]